MHICGFKRTVFYLFDPLIKPIVLCTRQSNLNTVLLTDKIFNKIHQFAKFGCAIRDGSNSLQNSSPLICKMAPNFDVWGKNGRCNFYLLIYPAIKGYRGLNSKEHGNWLHGVFWRRTRRSTIFNLALVPIRNSMAWTNFNHDYYQAPGEGSGYTNCAPRFHIWMTSTWTHF